MSELTAQFESSVAAVKQLTKRPDDETLLSLYAYYKQASEGDINGPRPGFFDFKASAKYDAWERLKGMKAETAQQAYIDLVERLLND